MKASPVPVLFFIASCGGSSGPSTGAPLAASAKPVALVVESPPVATSQTEPLRPEPPKVTQEPQDEVKLCTFQFGNLVSCRNAYTGPVQLLDDGAWLNCRVVGGRVTHCLGPASTGNVVMLDGPSFVQCTVMSGSLAGCHGPFTGIAPVARTTPRP